MADPAVQNDLPEYEPLRRRLQSQFAQTRQTSQDALQRRYAANGMLNSGAYQKESEIQDEDLNRQQADASGQLDFQQAQEVERRKELADQKAYQTSERLGSQDFSAGQAALGRQFTTSERMGGQAFQQKLYDTDMAFKKQVADNENYWKGLEFGQSQKSDWINALVALKNAGTSVGHSGSDATDLNNFFGYSPGGAPAYKPPAFGLYSGDIRGGG